MDSFFEAWICTAVPYYFALKNGSCAIDGCEPCQAGNRAALSSMFDVPQGRLFRVKYTVNAYMSTFDLEVYGLISHLALLIKNGGKRLCIRLYTENGDRRILMTYAVRTILRPY